MRSRLVVLAAGLVLAAGCSDQYAGRKAVTGKITLAGEPLAKGFISFEPLAGQNTQATLTVNAGNYSAPREQGLLPGKYRIRISAPDGNTTINEEEAGGPGGSANVTFADLVPAEWGLKSDKEVTVTADGKNDFPFDIPNKAVNAKKKGKK